jgi:hypothetical protein
VRGTMKNKMFALFLLMLCLSICYEDNSLAASVEDTKSQTEWRPVQIAIFNPVQLIDENKDIAGLRITLIYGKNTGVGGLDVGLGVNSSDNFTGIQIAGIMNNSAPDRYPRDNGVTFVKGIQIAGLGNTADNLYGIQLGGFGNGVTHVAVGIQVGLVGNVVTSIKGIQIAGIYNFNYPKNSSVSGIQIGAFNYAENVTGLQIGLLNECINLKGLQIGLINHIVNGRFPFLPIINAQF